MFKKLLIANRGEIACRIIKTARRLGIQTVAVYSTADAGALHVSLADEAICIGEPQAIASYLNVEAIIAAARVTHAEAIHPGYGFLSEQPSLARACEMAGLIFVGPSAQAMEAMGSKQTAKQLLEKTNVPLTPGYHGREQSDECLLKEAQRIGFPILIKAASGGGGKGMRAVDTADTFTEALAGARREAIASFGDDTLILEKLILQPRHVEVQVMADHHGHIVHLFERDCSIQRRHQKVIEEAPAPHLSAELKARLYSAAIQVAQAINYVNAGTVEFLVSGHDIYFMEMNTRLQVEHPVTELITGLDLVEWQLRIAANEPLPLTQAEIQAHGHAIECRVYAEDPQHDFLPSTGQLHFLKEPRGEGIRIDTGVVLNSTISQYYDPMIAKLSAWGSSREEAQLRLQEALRHYHIGGVKTNLTFLQAIMDTPAFTEATLTTDFLRVTPLTLMTSSHQQAAMLAACIDYLGLLSPSNDALVDDTLGWQMHLMSQRTLRYQIDDTGFDVEVIQTAERWLSLTVNNEQINYQVTYHNGQLSVRSDTCVTQLWVEDVSDGFIFYLPGGPVHVRRYRWDNVGLAAHASQDCLTAPMPATVVAILKQKGDIIKAGEKLLVLEAMKMEHAIQAPHDGVLVDIFYEIGNQVNEGALLVALEATS